jgi:hypothetical protein
MSGLQFGGRVERFRFFAQDCRIFRNQCPNELIYAFPDDYDYEFTLDIIETIVETSVLSFIVLSQ